MAALLAAAVSSRQLPVVPPAQRPELCAQLSRNRNQVRHAHCVSWIGIGVVLMIDRRLVTDLGLAALIAIPSVLPAAPTPRSPDSHVAAAQEKVAMADAREAGRSGELPG
jgi:hypothetical protein